jgi:hypothetical protein
VAPYPWLGTSQQAEYEGATKVIEHYLGIRQSKLSRYVHKLYVDVRDLPTDGSRIAAADG